MRLTKGQTYSTSGLIFYSDSLAGLPYTDDGAGYCGLFDSVYVILSNRFSSVPLHGDSGGNVWV